MSAPLFDTDWIDKVEEQHEEAVAQFKAAVSTARSSSDEAIRQVISLTGSGKNVVVFSSIRSLCASVCLPSVGCSVSHFFMAFGPLFWLPYFTKLCSFGCAEFLPPRFLWLTVEFFRLTTMQNVFGLEASRLFTRQTSSCF